MAIPVNEADRAIKQLGPVSVVIVCLACACASKDGSQTQAGAGTQQRPIASIQELMQAEVDTAADGVWDPVETIVTKSGTEERAPHTPQQWATVRNSALVLAEAANLLAIDGRRVGTQDFAAEADGALDSTHIQQLVNSQRPEFNGFAAGLREATFRALAAVDAQDPVALVKAGGEIDAVCEGCHLTFWYPNQVIPAVPEHAGAPPLTP